MKLKVIMEFDFYCTFISSRYFDEQVKIIQRETIIVNLNMRLSS